jgi:hypothetical protein
VIDSEPGVFQCCLKIAKYLNFTGAFAGDDIPRVILPFHMFLLVVGHWEIRVTSGESLQRSASLGLSSSCARKVVTDRHMTVPSSNRNKNLMN